MSVHDWQRFGDTNCGPGMVAVYDTPEEKEIERQRKKIAALERERGELVACVAQAVTLQSRWPTDMSLYPDEARWLDSARALLAKHRKEPHG